MSKFKDKERILKAARENQFVMYKVKPIKVLVGFSTETLQARRKWHNIQNVERKNFQSRILFLEKLSFKTEGEIKRFSRSKSKRGSLTLDWPYKNYERNFSKLKQKGTNRKT